jgi:hypothetical protein
MGRACRVSFVDPSGTKHTAEVVAETLYEAALCGLKAISGEWVEEPGPNTPIIVSAVPIEHQVTLRQIRQWVDTNPKVRGRSFRRTV